MNKKMCTAIIAATLLASSMTTFAGTIPKVNINDSKVLMQESPFNQNGRMYIPLRSVSENLGAKVAWDNATQTITITQGFNTISCRIGNDTARVNNKIVPMDAPPLLKNGTTYVPLRFVSEALGGEVKFDKPSNSVDIQYSYPQDAGQKYDFLGRSKRTTNLPKNAKDFSYVLEGIPNQMYELKPIYAYSNKKVEGKDYTRPVNMATSEFSKRYYSEENTKLWKEIIEKNLDLKFNVNYKTIDNAWADKMAQTYMDSKPGGSYYDRNIADTKKYVQYIKNNQVTIEGDYFVEPSICYRASGAYYMRVWVKFKGTSNKVNEFELYENNPQKIKTNTWYEGYVDIALSTNNGNSVGKDFGISKDSIALTSGIKEVNTI